MTTTASTAQMPLLPAAGLLPPVPVSSRSKRRAGGKNSMTHSMTPKTRLKVPKRDDYSSLQKHPIIVSDAATKYKVPKGTLRNWIVKKYIKVIHEAPPPMTIDEADIAFTAAVYHYRLIVLGDGNEFSGIPLFDDDGEPVLAVRFPDLAHWRRRQKEERAEKTMAK
jgi:hypothetical protein